MITQEMVKLRELKLKLVEKYNQLKQLESAMQVGSSVSDNQTSHTPLVDGDSKLINLLNRVEVVKQELAKLHQSINNCLQVVDEQLFLCDLTAIEVYVVEQYYIHAKSLTTLNKLERKALRRINFSRSSG